LERLKLRLRLRPFHNPRSALHTMIVTSLCILLIPLSMGLFLYMKAEGSLEKSTNRSNAALLEQLKLMLDNKLSEVDILSRQVVFDPKLDYMLKIPDQMSSADRYKFVEFMQDKMARYRNMISDFIFDYFVYFSRSDTIVKSDMITDSRTFYSTNYTFKGQSYEQWKKGLLDSLQTGTYSPVASLARGLNPLASLEDIPAEAIVYSQTLPVRSPSDNQGQFVVLIDVDLIKRMFAQLESASHSSIYIIDDKGRTIMSTSETPIPEALLRRTEQADAPFAYRMDGVDQMVSFVSSQQAHLRYISVTPNDFFMRQVNQIQTWSVRLLILCVLLGLLAVIGSVYRNYKPLQHTLNAIMSGKPLSGRPSSGEYEFIRQTIEGSIHEEKHLRSTLSKQAPFIRANYLSRLLQGNTEPDLSASGEEALKFMDLKFSGDRFAVLLVHIEDVQPASEDHEQQRALARFIVSNVSVDLIEPHHAGYPVELDRDRVAIIVNVGPDRASEGAEDLRSIAESLFDTLKQRFKMSLTVAVGDIHQGPKAVRDSCTEALAALEYRLIMGNDVIIHFRDIVGTNQHYYYPLETEIQLTNLVRGGDVDNVEKLLDKIFSMNFDANPITPELGKCLFFNVISTFLKIRNATNANPEAVLGSDFDPIKAVFSHQTAEGMQRMTKELYAKLTRSFSVGRSEHHTQLLQEVVGLVDSCLGDPNLGLAMIAERLGMTPQYISTFFKKHQGQTLLEYITQKRIKSSKQLMRDKELTIGQISQMVGYNNDVVFIRAFKKLEGVTPGKFREAFDSAPAVDHS